MHETAAPMVLVVNDDPTQLRLASALLSKDGFRTISCQSAEEALQVLHRHPAIDVIITDLHMPRLDGWRFCRLLRSPEYASWNHTPVLVVSATFSGEDPEQMTRDLGANAFLPAPYEPAALRLCVRELLSGQVPRMALRVLVIEGDSQQALALQRTFAAHGFAVAIANNGHEGRRFFRERRPEVVLVNYQLPDTTADRLLTDLIRPGSAAVAIVLTSEPSPEIALRCMRLGAYGYVRKPFDPEYVLDLCLKARRERALLRVEAILERRTRSLRASRARFRALFEGVPDPVLVHDPYGCLLLVNQACARWLEREVNDLRGRYLPEIVAPAYVQQMADHVRQTLSAGSSRLRMVYVTRTGRHLEAEVHKQRIELDGQVVLLDVVRDITAQVRVEAQMRQVQKLQALGTLAGGIAHEFNNLLTIIMGYTELALHDLGEPQQTEAHLQEILKGSQRARSLVQQIIDFSRQSSSERSLVSLHVILEEVLRMLRTSLAPTIRLEIAIAPDTGMVLADPAQIQQVVMHLCNNAIHAMGEEGGMLEVRLEEITLTEESAAAHPPLLAGPHLRLTVRDTGRGMSPEVLERIFEPFFTTKNIGEGTGMGLAVVDGIVARHHGAITVVSTPGQGSTFLLYFPRAEAPPEPMLPGNLPVARRGHERILFVDDEEALGRFVTQTLLPLGYIVATYTDSQSALGVFRSNPAYFDLVITDAAMPTLSGVILAQEVHQIRPDVPILLCSGSPSPVTPEEARELGIVAFLRKPFTSQEFAAALQRVFDQLSSSAGTSEAPSA